MTDRALDNHVSCLRLERLVTEPAAGLPLDDGDGGHHREGDDVEDDPDDGLLRLASADEGTRRLDRHIDGEEEEGDGDGPQRRPLAGGGAGVELPEHDGRGEDLDPGVDPEADQGDRAGGEARRHGDNALDDVPDDDEDGEADASPPQHLGTSVLGSSTRGHGAASTR